MRVGVLTGGGDCPGLNAVVRGIVCARDPDTEIFGFMNGWQGTIQGEYIPLTDADVEGIHILGGTILGTSRTNPFKKEADTRQMFDTLERLKIDSLIAIGGDDTLSVAAKMASVHFPVVGVPKTIDNDVSQTDYTFGFHTAVNVGADAIDRLHSTAKSHKRVFYVELMGREAGWIALEAGMAAGAHLIIIPEYPMTLDEILKMVDRRMKHGGYAIVAVAEGFKPVDIDNAIQDNSQIDAFGHIQLGGIANYLTKITKEKLGYDTRAIILGHLLRGGTPTAFDRILGSRYGVQAMELIKKKDYGRMVALKGNEIVSVPIEYAVATKKLVPYEYYKMCSLFFG